MEIEKVHAYYILDSRGLPTVEVRISTNNNLGTFKAAVPSGASTGSREACELRDGDKSKFRGKGVQKAIDNIMNILGPKLEKEKSISCVEQEKLDKLLLDCDGTEFKTKLGANAILPLSIAICRIGAAVKKVALHCHINDLLNAKRMKLDSKSSRIDPCMPFMFFNVLNGGKHADNVMVCQEMLFSIVNKDMTVCEMLEKASTVFHCLKDNLKRIGEATNVGDEGGFAPNLTPEKGIELILQSAKDASIEKDLRIAFDFAASEFEVENKVGVYDMNFKRKGSDKNAQLKSSEELLNYYLNLLNQNKQICSLEDPFSERDEEYFTKITQKVDRKQCQIVADDLTVTNRKIIEKFVQKKAANSLLVKLNQIGTISESLDSCICATNANWTLFVSHRSGETNDDFAADFAVGIGAESVKFGAPSRGERLAKYNRLKEIQMMHPELKMSCYNFRG